MRSKFLSIMSKSHTHSATIEVTEVEIVDTIVGILGFVELDVSETLVGVSERLNRKIDRSDLAKRRAESSKDVTIDAFVKVRNSYDSSHSLVSEISCPLLTRFWWT